jgi:tRNA(Ile)-lysidine synthase
LLINLFRGTRLEGLKSIKSINRKIQRPMMKISKTEIYDYANQHNLIYLEDPSNMDNKIIRNWIRNILIPEINEKFPGSFEEKVELLTNEVELRTNYKKDYLKYIKFSRGYLEIPISLISHESNERQFYLNEVASFLGMKSIEKNDLEKITQSLDNKKKFDFFKEWTCFNSGGSIIFLNQSQWRENIKEADKSFIGFFEFQMVNQIEIYNNWNLALPEEGEVKIKFFENGEKIVSDGISIKASEVLRNYGVDSAFRNNWPIVYIDNNLYWIVGLRKSDLAIENEKKSKKGVLQVSIKKDNLLNLMHS